MENRNEISRNVRIALGTGHVVLGIGLAMVLLIALTARYMPVDVPLVLIAALLTGSGAALLYGVRQGPMLARVASAVTLVVGLAFLTALLWTAAYLKGIYGDLGRGASAFFTLIVFTILPYLVIYPSVSLLLLRPPREAAAKPAEEKAKPAEEKAKPAEERRAE
jgi:hypothetical protein